MEYVSNKICTNVVCTPSCSCRRTDINLPDNIAVFSPYSGACAFLVIGLAKSSILPVDSQKFADLDAVLNDHATTTSHFHQNRASPHNR
jgi:hypothetical protein